MLLIHDVTEFMEANGIQEPPQCVETLESSIGEMVPKIESDIQAVRDWMDNYQP